MQRFTLSERIRIWIASRLLVTPRIWRRMCALGVCPVGIHAYEAKARRTGQEGRDDE